MKLSFPFHTKRIPGAIIAALIIAVLILTGCGNQSQPAQTGNTPAASTTRIAPTQTTAGTTPTLGNAAAAPANITVRVETFVTGLDAPWSMAFAPDGRIFLVERPGRLRIIQDGKLLPDAIAIPNVVAQGEGGQLGVALSPSFTSDHHIYLYFTFRPSSGGLMNRVVRYTERGNTITDLQMIIDNIPGGGTHNGGRIAFGPDGKLYVTTGDAGRSALSQDRESLAGKILRLNPDGSIPADNPFPNSPVYSWGHRNPQGLAWHPVTKQLYAPEHGSAAHDEVNRIVAGANYGWPTVTGSASDPRFISPLIESGTTTWAPGGATFWQGGLFFAALRGTHLHRLVLSENGEQVVFQQQLLVNEFGRLRDAVAGPDGALYVLTSNRDGRGSPRQGDDRILRITIGS